MADKLTLVQIRYMEKRINAARDAAEERLKHACHEARCKVPEVEGRTKAECVKALVDKHPTLTKAMAEAIMGGYYSRDYNSLTEQFGLDKAWLGQTEAKKASKAEHDKLIKRNNDAMDAVKSVAVEATDAIYLGDASQLNTILSKMDRVKF